MSLAFVETLRGSYFLIDQPDRRRVCEVAIQLRLSRSAAQDREIVATMTGTAVFDQLVTQQPIQGELRLRVSRPRHVTYTFEVQADDGRLLLFSGAKHPSVLRPIYAATTLWGTLSHNQLPLAMVRLQFDLRRDLVAFFQSLVRELN